MPIIIGLILAGVSPNFNPKLEGSKMSEKESTSMKIISLEAENVKKIKTVLIKPDGSTVLLTGKNGAGKSSVLDCIEMALRGGKTIPAEPIRHGEDDARIVLETENWIITRTFTAAGKSYLKVTNSEGTPATSPQKLLDEVCGKFSFKPISFIEQGRTEAGRKEQRKALMEVTGLNFDGIDANIASVKSQRSDAKKEKERLEHAANAIAKVADLPVEEVSVTELTEKLQKAMSSNATRNELIGKMETSSDCIAANEDAVNDAIEAMAILEERLAVAKASIVECEKKNKAHEDFVTATTKNLAEEIDTDAIGLEMEELSNTNAYIRQNAEKKRLQKAAMTQASTFQKLGKEMQKLEAGKAKLLAEVEMPVKGLSVDSNGVTFEGIPLDQVNTAKQLEIGVGVSMALNPTLKVIRMCGNDLDSDSLKVISNMVEASGYQVWIEKLDETGKIGVVIEDGEVVAVNG